MWAQTPQYYLPRPRNYSIHPALQAILYHLPVLLYICRILMFLYLELGIIATSLAEKGSIMRHKKERLSRKHAMTVAPSTFDFGSYLEC